MTFLKPLATLLLMLFACACIVSADCRNSRDWNIALVGSNTWYVAVPSNDQIHVVYADQCLDMTSGECVPCKDIRPFKLAFDYGAVGNCLITTFQPSMSKALRSEMTEIAIDPQVINSNATDNNIVVGPNNLITVNLMGHILWAMRCKH